MKSLTTTKEETEGRSTQGAKGLVKAEAETGMIELQAKGCQQLL
jgi:hypothetical protein